MHLAMIISLGFLVQEGLLMYPNMRSQTAHPKMSYCNLHDSTKEPKACDINQQIHVERIKTPLGYDGLKIHFTVKGTLQIFVSILNDVANYPYWSYKCIEAQTIKNDNNGHSQYYSILDFPWPYEDRILAADCHQHLDENGIFYSISKGITDKIDQKGRVPLPYFESKWTVQESRNNELKIEYTLISDPSKSIPAFIYNMAVEYGPVTTIQALIERVEAQYQKGDF